ncbi:MAG: diguanylate cyclase [Spirochaetales bacterium]|nr:diguanylate cyclase [Spirochaetales bacterium]
MENRNSWTIKYERDRLERLQNKNARRIKKKCFCIAICDIDFFKKVNDTYGHNYGDYIIKMFGNLIKSHIRKVD